MRVCPLLEQQPPVGPVRAVRDTVATVVERAADTADASLRPETAAAATLRHRRARTDEEGGRRRWREQRQSGLGWPTSAHPTPYEILNLDKRTPYAKARFYELVKLYHPDSSHHGPDGLAPAARLERYRLVVAANGILGDPPDGGPTTYTEPVGDGARGALEGRAVPPQGPLVATRARQRGQQRNVGGLGALAARARRPPARADLHDEPPRSPAWCCS